MGTSTTSFRSPSYAPIEADVEARLGLPRGMLASIRTKGERSNADQVSEAGARSVYQVIPATRNAIKARYGADAYASPEQAALAAGHILKESLERNGGNKTAAVAEYHGGTDRRQWGAKTRAYVQRVTGGGDPASADGGPSTFDRVQARQNAGPSMAKVYAAYRGGKMTPEDRTAFENAVNSGQIVLKPGWKISSKPSVAVLPQKLIDAYNSRQMDDDPDARAMIEQEVAAGRVALPKGVRLSKPVTRTAGEELGMGTRAVAHMADLGDLVAGPVNALVNALPGKQGLSTTPFHDMVESGADAVGLAKPESASELRNAAMQTGAAQGLATAGGGVLASPVAGVTGAVGDALAASPILDTVSGAASGGAQESARQAGAGPVGQVVAGLIAGAAPIGLAGTAERALTRRALPDVVADTPRAAVIDDAGNLTPHGQEIATRHSATPDQVREAYEAPPAVKTGTANEQLDPAVAREATTDAPVEPAPQAQEAPQELPPSPNAPDGADTRQRAPAAPAESLAATARARVEAGQAFGVDYSRGQATKSFDIQDAEARLKNSNGPAADEYRAFTAKQNEQVKTASENFRKAVDDTTATPEERGAQVQDAVRELRDLGQKGVTALYKQARTLGEGAPLDLKPEGIRAAYDRLMVEANVPDKVKAELTQEMARYGLIGKTEGTAENGVTTVKLAGDPNGARTISFYGKPESLRLDNAEDLRKVITGLYPEDGSRKLTTVLKKAIDDATEEAAIDFTKFAGNTGAEVPQAYRDARAAHIEQTKTFKSKDIVQAIADWKKGAEGTTGALKPEQVMQRALSSTSDLRRIKAVLLSGATAKSKAAWKAIQAHGLAELFEKATTRNTNAGGEITDAISGAKLRSAIETFGVDKLKVLLDSEQFNALMKLRRVIEDVTIPITGTTNPSGSGNLLMRLAKDADNQVTTAFAAAGAAVAGPMGAAVGGSLGRTIAPAIKAAKTAKAEAETLSGVIDYTPEKAAADDTGGTRAKPSKAARVKDAGADIVRAFIDIYSSPRILAPLLVSTEGARE